MAMCKCVCAYMFVCVCVQCVCVCSWLAGLADREVPGRRPWSKAHRGALRLGSNLEVLQHSS